MSRRRPSMVLARALGRVAAGAWRASRWVDRKAQARQWRRDSRPHPWSAE